MEHDSRSSTRKSVLGLSSASSYRKWTLDKTDALRGVEIREIYTESEANRNVKLLLLTCTSAIRRHEKG
jgi:hypothetical protein